MPAVNPRITITLPPSVHAMLQRLSSLTGNSQSAIVSDLLTDALPVFERMATVLDAAARLQAEGSAVPAEIRSGLEQAQQRLEQQLGLVLDIEEEGYRPILDAAERIARRRTGAATTGAAGVPATGRRRAGPPASNRGVTPHPKEGPRKAKGQHKGGVKRRPSKG